jgi:hypothetical protein
MGRALVIVSPHGGMFSPPSKTYSKIHPPALAYQKKKLPATVLISKSYFLDALSN